MRSIASGAAHRPPRGIAYPPVVGAIGNALGYPAADPLVGLLITVAIVFVLRQATGQTLARLMDAVEPELVDKVEGIARSTPSRTSAGSGCAGWGMGSRRRSRSPSTCDATVGQGHAIAEGIRHRLLHEVAKLDTAVIHVNPRGRAGADPHEALRHHDVLAGSAR